MYCVIVDPFKFLAVAQRCDWTSAGWCSPRFVDAVHDGVFGEFEVFDRNGDAEIRDALQIRRSASDPAAGTDTRSRANDIDEVVLEMSS
jgi:hypothetical protein